MDIKQLKEKYGDVKVFAIKDKTLDEWNISLCEVEKFLESRGEFVLRYEAEVDPEYRQIIPYCLIRCSDNYFITKRINGDERLINQYSIGMGGHIDFMNIEYNVIKNSLQRELDEELDIGCNIDSIRLAYMIRANKTEVDKVHLGLVYIIDVNGIDVEVKEKDVLEGCWISEDDLINFNGKLETWSKICVEELIK